MTNTDHNLDFLTEKIMMIRSALCCIECDSFSIRTHIVQTEWVDDEGNIYFKLLFPSSILTERKRFPLELTYYKKSFDYYMKVKAIGIIEDTENSLLQINEEGELQYNDVQVMVKAKIVDSSYVEYEKPFAGKGMLVNIKHTLKKFSKNVAMLFY
jgi:hypothetical protein